jgi:hypothetical protein
MRIRRTRRRRRAWPRRTRRPFILHGGKTADPVAAPIVDVGIANVAASTAYAIVHFGANEKYLEMELYLVCNLYLQTDHARDIVYLYAADTPPHFVAAVVDMGDHLSKTHYCRPRVRCVQYNDADIVESAAAVLTNADIFAKLRKRAARRSTAKTPAALDAATRGGALNAARTCGIAHAWNLPYSEICIVESDVVLVSEFDSVFETPSPAIVTYIEPKKPNQNLWAVNGGVMRLAPSPREFARAMRVARAVVADPIKYMYPSESLFTKMYPVTDARGALVRHSLPRKYNSVRRYPLDGSEIHGIHFSEECKILDNMARYTHCCDSGNNDYWSQDNIMRGMDYFFDYLVQYRDVVCGLLKGAGMTAAVTRERYYDTSPQPAHRQETRANLMAVRDLLKKAHSAKN